MRKAYADTEVLLKDPAFDTYSLKNADLNDIKEVEQGSGNGTVSYNGKP